MSWASSEIVSVLVFLLPGFVAAAVFYSLTSYPKPNEFGQVIQALIFTSVGQSIAWTLHQFWGPDASWSIGLEALVPLLSAVIFALIVVYLSNNDIAHSLFRRIRFTRENSYPSEWHASFARNPDCYVILNLKDDRRLFGWPQEWPSRPGQGHFRIIEAEWLTPDEDDSASEEGAEIFAIVVSVEDIAMVDLLRPKRLMRSELWHENRIPRQENFAK